MNTVLFIEIIELFNFIYSNFYLYCSNVLVIDGTAQLLETLV